MKFSSAIATLILAAAALTDALSLHRGGKQANLIAIQDDNGLKVPGESPLEHCSAGFEEWDILNLESVDLAPNPPQAGKTLTIKATGTLKQNVVAGAYVKITVKYGLIQLISTTMDLCEKVEEVDLKCPLEAGKLTITKDVELPAQIPPGTYNVFADVYSDDDEPITCLKAHVNFPRPGSFAPF